MFGFVTPRETLMYDMPKETNACFACHNKGEDSRNMQTLQKDLEKWGMVSWNKR
jgi:nitrate reductase cytochrome c-type subunit